MSPSSEETPKTPTGWRGAIKRIRSIHLNRFWEGVLVGVLTGVLATVIGTVIVNKFFPPSSQDDVEKQQIENLIANEAEFARTHDLQKYRDLFADDAWVIEVPKQHVWSHQDIVERLKPLHFTTLVHTPKQVVITTDRSVAFAETTTTLNQDRPYLVCCSGKEYWQFRRIGGIWKIVSFQFGLPQ